jgi:hypothetical protein
MLDLKLKSTNLSSTSSTSSYVYELPDERRLFIFGRGAIESLVRFQHVAPKRSLRNLYCISKARCWPDVRIVSAVPVGFVCELVGTQAYEEETTNSSKKWVLRENQSPSVINHYL